MRTRDRVVIGMVNDGTINCNLVIDLLQLMRRRTEKFDSFIQVANMGLLTRSRNVLVKNFLETTEASWLLMIDSDQRLEFDTWDKLIETAHDKDRPVVSALAFAAFFNDDGELRPVPTIYRMIDTGLQAIDDYPQDTVLKVDAVGTGCLLIHRDVLLEMQKNATVNQGPDWAWFVDGALNGTWFGEDLLFSKRLGSLGIPIHAHTGAITAHHKEFWLTERHHLPFREAAISSRTE